jgi:hypothetical protein
VIAPPCRSAAVNRPIEDHLVDNPAGGCLLAAAFGVCAFEAAELFFVVADLGGDGFEWLGRLVAAPPGRFEPAPA